MFKYLFIFLIGVICVAGWPNIAGYQHYTRGQQNYTGNHYNQPTPVNTWSYNGPYNRNTTNSFRPSPPYNPPNQGYNTSNIAWAGSNRNRTYQGGGYNSNRGNVGFPGTLSGHSGGYKPQTATGYGTNVEGIGGRFGGSQGSPFGGNRNFTSGFSGTSNQGFGAGSRNTSFSGYGSNAGGTLLGAPSSWNNPNTAPQNNTYYGGGFNGASQGNRNAWQGGWHSNSSANGFRGYGAPQGGYGPANPIIY